MSKPAPTPHQVELYRRYELNSRWYFHRADQQLAFRSVCLRLGHYFESKANELLEEYGEAVRPVPSLLLTDYTEEDFFANVTDEAPLVDLLNSPPRRRPRPRRPRPSFASI